MLDFADRTGSSIFMEVWPQMQVDVVTATMYQIERRVALTYPPRQATPTPYLPLSGDSFRR